MRLSDRCIGIIDSVSSSEVKAFLLDESPSNVAISNGSFTLFPRINGYLMIPNETGVLVGLITWIGYNHMSTQSDVNLPKGARMVTLTILGHIENMLSGKRFERGVFSLPTVGDQVLLPTAEELSLINWLDTQASFEIGTAPLLGNQPVRLPVNELFGRHVAVLGNTGSGKSCTVAGLVRWSIEECISASKQSPNARYIILDPNGEYSNAFNDLDMDVIHCSVKALDDTAEQLQVPAWMWTSSEWAGVLQASDKVQKPILREALRDLRSANAEIRDESKSLLKLNRSIGFLISFLNVALSTQSYINKSDRNNFGKEFEKKLGAIESISGVVNDDVQKKIDDFIGEANKIRLAKHGEYNGNEYYNPFDTEDIEKLLLELQAIRDLVTCDENGLSAISEDDPIEFRIGDLASHIDTIAQNNSSSQYVDFMTVRIKSMLANALLKPVIGDSSDITLYDWIEKYLGEGENHKGKICVIDLSLLPTTIIHLIVATISRLVFEALQRYRKINKNVLPTILVMEEAHTFIKRTSEPDTNSATDLCTKVFERIAREGRKYGLGLIVSSQRPSELSPTVLSQCNSFILHRIVNDRDQEMVRRLVPDNMGNILSELPALPTQKAIVLGTSVAIPVLIETRSLTYDHRPHSGTPDFWKIWNNHDSAKIDWTPIVNDWQKAKLSEE